MKTKKAETKTAKQIKETEGKTSYSPKVERALKIVAKHIKSVSAGEPKKEREKDTTGHYDSIGNYLDNLRGKISLLDAAAMSDAGLPDNMGWFFVEMLDTLDKIEQHRNEWYKLKEEDPKAA